MAAYCDLECVCVVRCATVKKCCTSTQGLVFKQNTEYTDRRNIRSLSQKGIQSNLTCLAAQSDVSPGSAHSASRLPKLRPYSCCSEILIPTVAPEFVSVISCLDPCMLELLTQKCRHSMVAIKRSCPHSAKLLLWLRKSTPVA